MELFRALAVLAEPPRPETARLAELLELPAVPEAWEYTELFVQQLYPYASVYLGQEGKLGGDARDLIGGFWRALGEIPPPDPDSLSLLLGLYAHLAELERDATDAQPRAAWRRVRVALLWEHLLSWLPLWLDKLDQIAPPSYRAWGQLLGAALSAEALALEADLPSELPLHLRDVPVLAAPEAGLGEVFLENLLAPVLTGVIVTRSDLAVAASELKLGLRAGERRYALRALVGQDAGAVLDWLGDQARSVATQFGAGPALVGQFWAARAQHAEDVLRAAAAQAREAC